MKKIIVLAMMAMMFASCGGRTAKQAEGDCCAADSVEVVVDSTAVAADTVVVAE